MDGEANQKCCLAYGYKYARVSSSGYVIIKLADGGHAIFKWYEAIMGGMKDVAMARLGDKVWSKMRSNTLEINNYLIV